MKEKPIEMNDKVLRSFVPLAPIWKIMGWPEPRKYSKAHKWLIYRIENLLHWVEDIGGKPYGQN